jgi:ABC-type polysaccharide/polyol phosphate export permease
MMSVYDSTRERSPKRVFMDLVRARELLGDLVRKDLRIRYRYAALGFLWALVEPIALMLILTLVLSVLMGQRGWQPQAATESAPLPLFILIGLLFWQHFAQSVQHATSSLLDNRNLVTKLRFTREVLPLAAMGYPTINLAIGLCIFFGLSLVFGGSLSLHALWLLPLASIQVVLCVGLGLLFSSLNVHYRDIGYMVNVALLFGFYASPVFYPAEAVTASVHLPTGLRLLYQANPMVGLLTAYRTVLFDHALPQLTAVLVPMVWAVSTALLGVVVFRRLSPTFSDYL